MSLSGLDDPAIIESYQTALAEAGGWFLLKYVGRDVLDLLGRGTGGVAEIKVSIDGYGEKSPLYGFLQYRRRKVVLRYVPEGVSRLVQARITVQFQSFLDKFSPHDTVFSLSVSTELTESALSSACSLHTASGSMTSSSSSLRRRKLVEITEDAEENGIGKEESQTLTVEKDTDALSQRSDATAVPSHREQSKDVDTRSTRTDSTSRPSGDVLGYEEDKAAATHQQHLLERLSQPTAEPRKSSQSTRPSTRDMDLASLHRPKVKLGPRPSADNTGRPRTAGSLVRNKEPRPIATMPAGLRPSASQRSSNTSRPRSQPSNTAPQQTSSRNAPPVPAFSIPTVSSPSVPRPPLSPSVKSFMTTPEPGITPEKQRLMRALQLRQKQMEKRAEEKKKSGMKEPKVEVEEVADVDTKENTTDSVAADNHPASAVESSQGAVTQEEEPQETPLEPTAAADSKPLTPDSLKPDSAVDIVVTEDTDKAVESTSDPTFASSQDVVEPTAEGRESSPSDPVVSDETQIQEPDPSDLVKENQVEQDQLSPETDSTVQDSEQDSSSVNETGSPSHETSTTTIDIPEDLDSAGSKTNGETPTNAVETGEPDDQPSSKENDLPLSTNTEPEAPELVDDSSTKANGSEAGDEIPEPKVNASEVEKAEGSLEPAGSEPQTDIPANAGTEETHSDNSQNNEDSVSDEPSGRSSSTERAVEPKEDSCKIKRRALVDPIQVSTDRDESDDDNLLSDDSFMDELTSATVQEAKPVSVGKSPIASSFASNDDDRSSRPGSRAVSNPNVKHPLSGDVQALPVGRSASGSYFDRSQDVPVLVAKKVNVSSGISKRIKALEMFSSRDPSPGPTPAPPSHSGVSPAPSSSAFEKFRKRSSISQSNLPSGLTPSPKPSQNVTPSPPSESTASKAHIPSRKESLSSPSLNRGKSNSVSVTARIVRGNSSPQSETPSENPESNVLNLQCSPLIVERDTREDEASPQQPASAAPKSDGRSLSVSSSTGSRRNSFASMLPRSDSTASRLSGSSKSKGEGGSKSTTDLPPSPLDSVDEGKEGKKESRKSRILRRMSSITSNSRRGVLNSLSPTVTEEETASPAKTEDLPPAQTQVVEIGEVNVQFPDTLLWKRRFMRIDDQGYLILTPGNMDGSTRNIVKRYHLSEFKTPCLPDHDRQELPNSILLDFCDGSTLQCACESRQGQSSLLQTLVEAHSACKQVHKR